MSRIVTGKLYSPIARLLFRDDVEPVRTMRASGSVNIVLEDARAPAYRQYSFWPRMSREVMLSKRSVTT